MILLLVLGIMFLTSFAAPYKNYAKAFNLLYPDTMGFIGGFLFGVPLSWIFLRPYEGSLSKASRREKCLFITGLIWTLVLIIILVSSFSFGEAPKAYWEFDGEKA